MGWIKDIIDDIIDWIEDKLIHPLVKWIQETVEDIVVWYKTMRHNMIKAIAKWLDNDWNFLIGIAGVIVAIIYVPMIAKWFTTTKLYQTVSAVVEAVYKKIIGFFDVRKIIDYYALHQILLVFWGDYRELNATFANAVSALAGELGQGTGYIHALFASARGIMYSTAAVAGQPIMAAEMEFYDKTTVFFRKLDVKFSRYARDPGLVITDFIDEILIPEAEKYGKLQTAEVEELNQRWDRTLEIENGLKLFQSSVNDFIDILPNEIEKQFEDRWHNVDETMTEIFATIDREIVSKINRFIEIIEEREERIVRMNKATAANHKKLLESFTNYKGVDEEDSAIFEEAIEYYGSKEMIESLQPIGDYVSQTENVAAKLRDLQSKLLGSFPYLEYERDTPARIPDRTVNIPSPFVGEY